MLHPSDMDNDLFSLESVAFNLLVVKFNIWLSYCWSFIFKYKTIFKHLLSSFSHGKRENNIFYMPFEP